MRLKILPVALGVSIFWPTLIFPASQGSITATKQTAEEHPQSEKSNYPKKLVRERIATIIQTSVRQAHIRTSDGLEVTTRPLMSRDDYQQVSKFGEEAIPVLLEYQNSEDDLQQEDAIRLLCQFKSDRSLQALEEFALKSHSTFARATALNAVASEFPAEKSMPILKKAAKFDRDPRIRKSANKLLAKLSVSHPD